MNILRAVLTVLVIFGISMLAVASIWGQDTPKPILIDELAVPDCEMMWSRLDAFSNDLGKNPTATGQVEISPDVSKPPHINFYWYRMLQGYAAYRRIPHNR